MANALHESFDNGVGALSNAWNVDTSTPGQVTLAGSSAMMEWATGPSAGHGYGTYTIHAEFHGSEPGPAIVFWPGDNNWPGQEIDMGEFAVDGSGRQYGVVHWNANGSDAFEYRVYDGVQAGTAHDYTMVWEPGQITFKVDGVTQGVITDHVPVDYDHGGMNDTIGLMNTNPNTSVTVTQIDYTPLGESTPVAAAPAPAPAPTEAAPAPAPAPAAEPASSAAIDWESIAAVVNAYHDQTGVWADYDQIIQAGGDPAAGTAAATVTWTLDQLGNGADIDWNSLAAQVEANFQATGHWFI